MSEVNAILLAAAGLGGVIATAAYFGTKALQNIQLTLAKLPTHIEQKREVVLPPREAARQGDVTFHIPSVLFGDRE